MQPFHVPPQAPPQPPARKSSTLALIALALAIAGTVVFPLLALIITLGLKGNRTFGIELTGAVGSLALGAISIIASAVLAIVSLVQKRNGAWAAIVSLVLGVLSIPIGLVSGFFSFLFMAEPLHGRPVRVGNVTRRTPTARGRGWAADGPSPAVEDLPWPLRRELAEAWRADAALEHASIAAFGTLALDLVALGAPPALLQRTHEAALDEVAHARDCFALASAYGGEPVTAAPFPEVAMPRMRESKSARLRRVAIESAIDGCLGEGTAADAARVASQCAEDPAVAEVLGRIARDEQRHADLAWDILAWCLEQDPALLEPVREAVARSRAPRVERDLPKHGRVGSDVWAASHERVRRALEARLDTVES